MKNISSAVAGIKKQASLIETTSVTNVRVSGYSVILECTTSTFNIYDTDNNTMMKSNTVFVSLSDTLKVLLDGELAILTTNPTMAWEQRNKLITLLRGAKAEIAQMPVKAGDKFPQPFSDQKSEEVSEHDTYKSFLINVELNLDKMQEKILDKLIDLI